MSTSVYLVTDGSYSDYRVLGVYSTRELADEAAVLFQADNDVEVYELDATPERPPGHFLWCVYMDRDGNTVGVFRRGAQDYEKCRTWEPAEHLGQSVVSYVVWGLDEKHAVKVANEKRTQLIAANEYTESWEVWRDYYLRKRKEAGL